ncbi:hypothetical protein BK708_04300 [Bacillus thuringiensis serovar yunnanensis]|nr:hypothetical protein BK708_04300 [Bacillus thuringiensis serovar yunnanensis]
MSKIFWLTGSLLGLFLSLFRWFAYALVGTGLIDNPFLEFVYSLFPLLIAVLGLFGIIAEYKYPNLSTFSMYISALNALWLIIEFSLINSETTLLLLFSIAYFLLMVISIIFLKRSKCLFKKSSIL